MEDIYGYVNESGEFVIPPQFANAKGFSEGLAAVNIGWMRCYIDSTGSIQIKLNYPEAQQFSQGCSLLWSGPFAGGLAPVDLMGKLGYLNRRGEWVWEPQN